MFFITTALEKTEGPPMAVVEVIVLAHAVPCPHLPYSQ